ncbi:SDR family oxidoreductase [soil metagenome]
MPTALITGSTDGIGLALARHLRSLGWRVITHGRRLVAAASEPDHCRADLAAPATAARTLDSFLASRGICSLDLLVHNAAAGYVGSFTHQADQGIRDLVATNLQAPVAISHALAAHVQAARGKIVFIGSVVASLPCPDFAVYTATKAALAGFVRSLRAERHLRAQILHPGATPGNPARCGRSPLARSTAPSPAAPAASVPRWPPASGKPVIPSPS